MKRFFILDKFVKRFESVFPSVAGHSLRQWSNEESHRQWAGILRSKLSQNDLISTFYETIILIIITFILLILFTSCSNDISPNNYRKTKLHYTNSNGEKGITTFIYSENGLMEHARWKLVDNSKNSMNYYTYDKNGNVIKKYREFADSSTSLIIHKYNKSDQLISEHFERSDGIKGDTYYNYDENGNLTSADCKGLGGWFYGKITYKCNKSNKKIRAKIYKDNKQTGTISYTYDKNGNLITEFWDLRKFTQTLNLDYEAYNKNQKTYTSSNIFINESNKYRLIKEVYDFNNEVGGPSSFTYEEGKLIQKVFRRSDDFKTTTSYDYDEEGLLVQSRRNYPTGKYAFFDYFYNGNRKLIQRVYETSDGIKGMEKYQYNDKLQLVKANYNNFDTWLTGNIIFEYKGNNIVKGHFQGPQYKAQILFNYNEKNNLKKIHWDFTFGKRQTYSFEYEEL